MIVLTSLVPPIHHGWSRCGFCCSSSTILRTFSLPLPLSPPPPIVKEQVLCCKTRYRYGSCSLSSSNFSLLNQKPNAVEGQALGLTEEDDDEFQLLTALRSRYNDIVIVDTPKSRMLLLDSTLNVHSIFNKGQKWTGSYWDEFASLPAIIPKGPIAILGLGGGTAAHLMLELWPSLQLDGWEIDEILIDKARDYLGLSDLEKHTQAGGILRVHVGDALSPSVNVPGGYAGIVIDLFSGGRVLPQLQEVATWLELNDKLMPNGRLMVNCGAANDGASSGSDTVTHPKISSIDDTWVKNSTIKALCEVFPGNLSWKKMPKNAGENYLALTGPLPDLTTWSDVLPDQLSVAVKQWRPCCPS